MDPLKLRLKWRIVAQRNGSVLFLQFSLSLALVGTSCAAENTFPLVAESPAFPLDTRAISFGGSSQAVRLVAEADAFSLDTRTRTGNETNYTVRLVLQSAPFLLETRPNTSEASLQTARLISQSEGFPLDTRPRADQLIRSLRLVAESPSFVLDTRSAYPDSAQAMRLVMVSQAFHLDTRLISSNATSQPRRLVEESDPFPLDTRPRTQGFTSFQLVMESPPFTLNTLPGFLRARASPPDAKAALEVTTDGFDVQLSWPEGVEGFVLESATAVEGASWARVPETPTLIGGRFRLSLPISSQARFFRLRRAP